MMIVNILLAFIMFGVALGIRLAYDTYIVDETDMSCTSQETNGKIELTLITCDNNDNKKRLVVKCRV